MEKLEKENTLLSFDNDFKKEPWRLQLTIDDMSDKLKNICVQNYSIYIQADRLNQTLTQELHNITSSARGIQEDLVSISKSNESFQEVAGKLIINHEKNQYTLQHYRQLMDILEIPQLIDTCIRNNMFEESIHLIIHVQDISRIYDPINANHIIQTLLNEVESSKEALRLRLLAQLRGEVNLPQCLSIVSHIRRVDMLTDALVDEEQVQIYENKIRNEFLQCRNVWLDSQFREISPIDPYQYLVNIIETKRTSWFDLITQYEAIFGNRSRYGKVDEHLSNWALKQTVSFVSLLERNIPRLGDFSSIATILEQSMFFAGSLGRLGFEFRDYATVAPIAVFFENQIFMRISSMWVKAIEDFETTLTLHLAKTKGYATPLVMSELVKDFQDVHLDLDDVHYPPKVLMSYPILAVLTNAFLESFNELRYCTIVSLQSKFCASLSFSIKTVIHSLGAFKREVLNGEERNAEDGTKTPISQQIDPLAMAVLNLFIPYIVQSFQVLYGDYSLNNLLIMNDFRHVAEQEGLIP